MIGSYDWHNQNQRDSKMDRKPSPLPSWPPITTTTTTPTTTPTTTAASTKSNINNNNNNNNSKNKPPALSDWDTKTGSNATSSAEDSYGYIPMASLRLGVNPPTRKITPPVVTQQQQIDALLVTEDDDDDDDDDDASYDEIVVEDEDDDDDEDNTDNFQDEASSHAGVPAAPEKTRNRLNSQSTGRSNSTSTGYTPTSNATGRSSSQYTNATGSSNTTSYYSHVTQLDADERYARELQKQMYIEDAGIAPNPNKKRGVVEETKVAPAFDDEDPFRTDSFRNAKRQQHSPFTSSYSQPPSRQPQAFYHPTQAPPSPPSVDDREPPSSASKKNYKPPVVLLSVTESDSLKSVGKDNKKDDNKASSSCQKITAGFLVGLVIGVLTTALLIVFLQKKNDQEQQDSDQSGLGNGPTTAMTPFNPGNCDFRSLELPHVIDQCACDGYLSIMPQDVQSRYNLHLNEFIPSIYQEYSEDMDSCSIRNQALVWLSSGNDYLWDDVERKQRYALAVQFLALQGQQWKQSNGWLSDWNSCLWFGVECQDTTKQRVTSISLNANNLGGSLQRELLLMQSLTSLSFTDNQIGGTLPSELFYLRNLIKLDLISNLIGGTVPDVSNAPSSLTYLFLSDNKFRGAIPVEWSELSQLNVLDLRNNQLTGELPTGLSDLESLVELRLDSNLLTGALPAFLGNLTSLETLVVSGNGFVEERVAEEICLLRGENLQEFVVDCPTRADGQLIHGVGCSIPVCCTKCL